MSSSQVGETKCECSYYYKSSGLAGTLSGPGYALDVELCMTGHGGHGQSTNI